MKTTAVALIDGEHYPSVVVDALDQLSDQFEFLAALFLGGTEKLRTGVAERGVVYEYGLPVVFDVDRIAGLRKVLADYRPRVVVDLSDEPVLGYSERFRLISESLVYGATYIGSDFRFNPVTSDRLCTSPSLSIVGTGKRVGKTALSGFVARSLAPLAIERKGEPGLVVVAMGRGGPSGPEVVNRSRSTLSTAELLSLSRSGRHAASDCYEDATLSRIATIGCRRCGGGMAGEPFVSNVAQGALVANALDPALVIFEGSGSAMPPVGTDSRLVVVGAHQPVEYVTGYLGPYRLLTSDAMVITMAEEPLASKQTVRTFIDGAREINGDLAIVPTVFRPQPASSVKGRRVALFTTAPRGQRDALRRHLEEVCECRVEMVSTNLSDRRALDYDLAQPEMGRVDTILTEIKAAAIDVVAEAGQARGLEVVFVDNVPVEVPPAKPGDLAVVARDLFKLAEERFAAGRQ